MRHRTTQVDNDLRAVATVPTSGFEFDGPASPYEPIAVETEYGNPQASVSPDTSRGWIRRMLPMLLVRRRLFALVLLGSLISMAAKVAVPRVMMAGIDNALRPPADQELQPYVVTVGVLGVIYLVVTFLYRWQLRVLAFALEYDLRVTLYRHFTRLSFSFYDRVQSGQLISRANSDIRSVQMFLTFAPVMALQFFSFLMAFVLMIQVHAGLAVVALLPLPFVFWTGVRMRNLLFPVSWLVQERMAGVAGIVEENVSGSHVVKSFAAEEEQIRQLKHAARKLRWAHVEQVDVRARYAPLMENLPRVGMAMVLLYGGWLVIQGQVTVGAILAFSTYVVMLQGPFRMLGMLMMMGQRAAASAQRIFEILDTEPEIASAPGSIDLVEPRGELEFRDVTFTYPNGPQVLRHLDLHVPAGETVAIVGRTGSGKSTIARLLDRFYDVDEGRILIDGADIRDLTLPSLRHHVGIVLDEPFLFSATVRENIAYGRPDATLEEVEEAARAANAHEFIERLRHGYDTQVGERGYTLSGGQRQRIAIARTLLVNPRVLVLDDATSAIDVKVEEEIHDALRTLMRGRTTLVIAHRLSTISLARRVMLLEDGTIVADGTHAELMQTEPRYAEVLAHIDEDETRADAEQGAAKLGGQGPLGGGGGA